MSTKHRQLFFVLAASTLVIGSQSSPVAGQAEGCTGHTQKCQTERWQILNDNQTKALKSQTPKGTTGPTIPPKPTQGNVHR
jgi:hypothetical protein